jgi:N-acetyl-alpha-D-muramate 1-phosphate uridylyltransferase
MGVTDVVLALGHGGEAIQNHVEERQADPRYPQVNYSFDGPELLGTGGAVKKAQAMLSKDFAVAYGDSFLFLNVKNLAERHKKSKKPLTFSIYENKNVGDRSNVFWDGKILKYDKFRPTPDMKYIDYGLSIVNKDYFLQNTPDGNFDFASFLTQTIDMGRATPYVAGEIFQEIGSPLGYARFGDLMKGVNFDLEALAHSRSLL